MHEELLAQYCKDLDELNAFDDKHIAVVNNDKSVEVHIHPRNDQRSPNFLETMKCHDYFQQLEDRELKSKEVVQYLHGRCENLEKNFLCQR